ncbi:MAG: hypothetical protein OXC11_15425 [Rhodospirillales bacterium]|nr:hypothetical protein [Rhodospirillales bacterium]
MTNDLRWAFRDNGKPIPIEDGKHLFEFGTRKATTGEKNDAGARAKRVLIRVVRIPLPAYLAEMPAAASEAERVILDGEGQMFLKPTYRWDGASGLTIDTVSSRRAALAHDACYTMLRQRKLGLSEDTERKLADQWLRDLLLEDGIWRFRAAYWYWAVCRFGASAAGM